MNTIKVSRRVAAAALSVGVLMVAAPASAQEKPQYGGHLTLAYNLEPTSLDPVLSRSGGDAYFWKHIFDELINLDRQGTPDPTTSLATSWEISKNPNSFTLTLREGVKFHDGTPFNAEAVKKNIDRVLNPATKATPRAQITTITSVEVLGPYKVKLNLSGPWAAGLGLFSDRAGAMSSPTAIAKLLQDYGWSPSGTGPFKVKEVVTGSHVHLVRNENYWGRDKDGNKLPYLDEVTIKIIKDETVLASSLKTGQVDVAYLPYRDADAFMADKGFKVEKFPGGNVSVALVFNPDVAPLNNVNLRRAVIQAINPADINKAVYFGKAIVADAGMWPVGTWVYQPNASRPTYDPKKAKESLAAGGMPGGFEISMVSINTPALQQAAEIMRAQLGRVGIKLNLDMLTVGAAADKFFVAKTTPLSLTSWPRFIEPELIAATSYRSGGFYNVVKQPNAALDALLDQGAGAYDQKTRKEIYGKVDDIILGQALWVPLLYGTNHLAAAAKVQNLGTLLTSDARFDLRTIWLKK